MPRKPKFSSPIRELRLALGQTQKEFADMLGLSCSYGQAIELGQRLLTDELCDDIELKFGIKPGSLKRKQGVPVVWLFEEATVAILPKRISALILKKLRKLRSKPRDRLRYQISLWKEMAPAMEKRAPREEVVAKLQVLLDAAAAERKHLTTLWQLDRWIEDQLASLSHNSISEAARRSGIRGVLGKQPITLPLGSLIKQSGRSVRARTSVAPRPRRKAACSA
jgi:transcriptional regulator with XRE-family HTH domain